LEGGDEDEEVMMDHESNDGCENDAKYAGGGGVLFMEE